MQRPISTLSSGTTKPVERLFPFALRSRCLIVGRDNLQRARSKLHFVLITRDLSEGSRKRILEEFGSKPIFENYTAADLERFFGLKNTKVIGFKKGGLSQSIYSELSKFRITSGQAVVVKQKTPPRSNEEGPPTCPPDSANPQ